MKKKLLLISIFLLFITLLFCNNAKAASDFTLKQMNFNATLNEDGSMRVIETWNVKIHDTTNTLFKTFKIDNTKYKSMQDVSVEEITNGSNKIFTQINNQMYHVTTDCFYALKINSSEYEIAWGVNKNSRK